MTAQEYKDDDFYWSPSTAMGNGECIYGDGQLNANSHCQVLFRLPERESASVQKL